MRTNHFNYNRIRGQRDFEIKQALKIEVEEGMFNSPAALGFTWEAKEFLEDTLKIQLHFDQPRLISAF
jgi:hypothetical protein